MYCGTLNQRSIVADIAQPDAGYSGFSDTEEITRNKHIKSQQFPVRMKRPLIAAQQISDADWCLCKKEKYGLPILLGIANMGYIFISDCIE